MEKTTSKTFFNRYRIIILVVIAVIIASMCSYFIISAKRIERIVLISIDTCRADYLSCYGYSRNTTPNIDELAKEGILFENVISPVPLTLPAHSSMFTGTIGPYHGVHDNTHYKLASSNITLAEILKEAGFATSAFIGAFVLDSQFGMDQGFDTYNDDFEERHMAGTVSERKGAEVSRLGIQWLENNRDRDFFLFLHYYDPHNPYEPPPPFSADYVGNQYGGEIAYTDHCIGQVIAKLKELALYESTLIIVTGDHGEMLGEHGEKDHGFFIYQSAIKVPLIFKLPGQSLGKRVSSAVGLIDIVPTVCCLLGIKPPVAQGKSLSDYWRHQAEPVGERFLYTETLFPTKYNANTLFGLVTDKYKYIQSTRPELYDLVNDPCESRNLAANQPQRARILKERLREIMEESRSAQPAEGRSDLDVEALKRLGGLGYVGGSIVEDFEFGRDKADPKDFIAFHVLNADAHTLSFLKKYGEAKAAAEKLIAQKPGSYIGYDCLADIALEQNDYATAVTYLQKALALAITRDSRFSMHLKLCKSFGVLGRFEEAITHGEKTVELRPQNTLGYTNLGQIMIAQKKYDRAVSYLTKASQLNPEETVVLNNLAEALVGQGRVARGLEHYEKSLVLSPFQHDVRWRAALLYYQQGLMAKAVEHWTIAIKYEPDRPAILNGLAWIKATSADSELLDADEAVRLAGRACELTGFKEAAFLDTLGAALAAAGRFGEAVESGEKALELAESEGLQGLGDGIRKRVELYKVGKAYRE